MFRWMRSNKLDGGGVGQLTEALKHFWSLHTRSAVTMRDPTAEVSPGCLNVGLKKFLAPAYRQDKVRWLAPSASEFEDRTTTQGQRQY